MTAKAPPTGRLAAWYASQCPERQAYLDRARRCALLTIPALFRQAGATGADSTPVPWQSLGAYGVNILAAKEIMALFPPGIPFIKLKADRKTLEGLQQLDPEARGAVKQDIDRGLSGVEQEFIEGIEEDGDRWVLFDAKRHGIVGGNHGIKILEDASLQSIPLEQYVTVRDRAGKLLAFCVEDPMEWDSLPEDMQELAKANGYTVEYEEGDNKAPKAKQQPVCVYTFGRLRNGVYNIEQEVCGVSVPGSKFTYNEDALPFLFLREIALRGEHYGRSYVEDYEGDLQTLDGFWQLLTEGAAAAAILKWLIKPGGLTNKDAFMKAQNGAAIAGEEGDVSAVRAEKGGDLAFAVQLVDRIERRVERNFCIFVQRQGERVTGEEIRRYSQELEQVLGGVYSNQITTFQTPYARLKMKALQRQGRVTRLPEKSVKMTILTGTAGLGRDKAAMDLDDFLTKAAAVLGPTVVPQYVKVSSYLERSASNRSIDLDGLVLTDDEVQQNVQQQQMQGLASQVAPEVVRQGGQMIQNVQTAALAPPTGGDQAAA
jgi:hypothetical protein